MRKIVSNILGLILALVMFTGCQDEYEFMDVEHSFVQTSFGNQAKRMQVNGWFSVHDLSRGVESRKWVFPDVAIGEDSAKITESTEQNVMLSLTEPGTYTIKVQQTFADNVYVDGVGFTDSKEYEESIEVVVVDSVRASFAAKRVADNSDLDLANGALNEVVAGRIVEFESTATGEPNAWIWHISREDGYMREVEGEDGIGEFKFSSPGVYNLAFMPSSAFGADTIVYTDLIEVVASTDPVLLDDVIRSSENEIGLVFSRSMRDASDCDPDAFDILITNGGTDVPVEITGFSTEENIVKIQLDDQIYNSDVITVSYDASIGNLITEDAMEATSFENAQVDFKPTNILAEDGYDFGFENSDASNWPYLWWGAPYDGYTLEILSSMKHSGDNSMMINMDSEGGAIFDYKVNGNAVTFEVESGKIYEFGIWIYMEQLGNAETGANLAPDLRFYPNDWSAELMFAFGADFPTGEWVYRSAEWDNSSDGELSFFIRGYNASSTVATKFYMDDMILFEKEIRP